MGIRNFALRLLCAGMACGATGAMAFQADGFWSGMSREQLAATTLRLGIETREGPQGRFMATNAAAPWSGATFAFCGNALVAYSRNISSDQDYAATLAHLFGDYGPPREMNFAGDVSTDMDTGAGTMQSRALTKWYGGNDRIRLKSYFDWRFYRGNLGRFQPATILYEVRNPCLAP
jgi:hypothetical protein